MSARPRNAIFLRVFSSSENCKIFRLSPLNNCPVIFGPEYASTSKSKIDCHFSEIFRGKTSTKLNLVKLSKRFIVSTDDESQKTALEKGTTVEVRGLDSKSYLLKVSPGGP